MYKIDITEVLYKQVSGHGNLSHYPRIRHYPGLTRLTFKAQRGAVVLSTQNKKKRYHIRE